MSFTWNSFPISVSTICRLGLIIVSYKSHTFCVYFLINLTLTLSEYSHSSPSSSSPVFCLPLNHFATEPFCRAFYSTSCTSYFQSFILIFFNVSMSLLNSTFISVSSFLSVVYVLLEFIQGCICGFLDLFKQT